jgi:hypothetical protein
MRAHRQVQAAHQTFQRPTAAGLQTSYDRIGRTPRLPARGIGLRHGEGTGEGGGELDPRHDSPKLAIGEGVSGAPNAEAKREQAARHCLAEFISNLRVGF